MNDIGGSNEEMKSDDTTYNSSILPLVTFAIVSYFGVIYYTRVFITELYILFYFVNDLVH